MKTIQNSSRNEVCLKIKKLSIFRIGVLNALKQVNSIIINMSAQQLPCILDLHASAEKEAQRESERLKQADLSSDQQDQLATKIEAKEVEESEILLHIDEQAIIEKKNSIVEPYTFPETKTNIFQNKQAINLFTYNQTILDLSGLAIYKTSLTVIPPETVTEEEEVQSSQHEEIVAPDQPNQQPEKPSPESKSERLGKFKLVKFKAGTGAVREDVFFVLEKITKGDMKLLYLTLKSEITKVVVYRACFFPNTNTEDLMNREDSIKLTVIRLSHLVPETEKPTTKEQLKLQFETADQSRRFKQSIQDHPNPS